MNSASNTNSHTLSGQQTDEQALNRSDQLYCTFTCAGRLYGVPVLDVKEVTNETRATPIPHAPEEVLGLVNIRGHIYLALNLVRLITATRHTIPDGAQMIIFKPNVGMNFGIVVDKIGDIVQVRPESIEPFAAEQRAALDLTDRSALVAEVCKLDDQLLIVLDPRRFLTWFERVT